MQNLNLAQVNWPCKYFLKVLYYAKLNLPLLSNNKNVKPWVSWTVWAKTESILNTFNEVP